MATYAELGFFLLISYLIMFVLTLLLVTLIIQYCWNNTISPIFNTNQITYFESFLLYIMCNFLFGGLISVF